MKFTHQLRKFYWGMCWHAAFVLGTLQKPKQKETYGFKTLEKAPKVPELNAFKEKLHELVAKLEFRKSTNNLQKKMKKQQKKMKKEKKLIIKADKSNKYYKMEVKQYSELHKRETEKEYKKSNEKEAKKVTQGDKKIAKKLDLDDRIFKTSNRESFLTLKDHKENFINNKQSRLLNPTKSEIGKISKKILEKVRDVVIASTQLTQWKNTVSVLQWFKNIVDPQRYSFIQFDIINYYPSISEKLLTDALNWASTIIPISDDQRNIIFHVRQNFLYNNGEPMGEEGANKL